MGVVRLAVCVTGVYATFLLWAIAQERLVSVPFPSKYHPTRLQPPTPDGSHKGDKFPSPIFLTFIQAVASSLCAFTYLCITAYRNGTYRGRTLSDILGFTTILASVRGERGRVLSTPMMMSTAKFGAVETDKDADRDRKREKDAPVVDLTDSANGDGKAPQRFLGADAGSPRPAVQAYAGEHERKPWFKTLPGLVAQVAVFQTTAGPIGFLALEHISYPTMVLGKSCKLIPVLLLNVLIYRRRFSAHKYVVVGLVTIGISLFMLLGDKKKKGGSDSMLGLSLLLINLFIDGLTNSTQDQIFATYKQFTGQQMMFIMALLTQLLLLPFLILPLPSHPLSLLHHLPIPLTTHLGPHITSSPLTFARPAFTESINFLLNHPTALSPLLAFACLGGLGQLFIFETIQHFGSLTLVMVTVTRKLFTMLLSVLVFQHDLSRAQWVGVAVVFSGIGVEAGIKRRDVMRRARRVVK